MRARSILTNFQISFYYTNITYTKSRPTKVRSKLFAYDNIKKSETHFHSAKYQLFNTQHTRFHFISSLEQNSLGICQKKNVHLFSYQILHTVLSYLHI